MSTFSPWRRRVGVFPLKSRQRARNPSVFGVVTVVHVPGYMRALLQGSLETSTLKIVQQDCPCAWSKGGFTLSHQRHSTAQLATHYLSIRQVPSVIANRSPAGVRIHLHPTLTLVLAAHQSHHSCNEWINRWNHVDDVWVIWVDFVKVEDILCYRQTAAPWWLEASAPLLWSPVLGQRGVRRLRVKEQGRKTVYLLGSVRTQEVLGDRKHGEPVS